MVRLHNILPVQSARAVSPSLSDMCKKRRFLVDATKMRGLQRLLYGEDIEPPYEEAAKAFALARRLVRGDVDRIYIDCHFAYGARLVGAPGVPSVVCMGQSVAQADEFFAEFAAEAASLLRGWPNLRAIFILLRQGPALVAQDGSSSEGKDQVDDFKVAMGREAVASASRARREYVNPHLIELHLVPYRGPAFEDDVVPALQSLEFYQEGVGMPQDNRATGVRRTPRPQ